MKRIVYTGPIADLYDTDLMLLLIDYGFDFMRSRVERSKDCRRPVIVMDVRAKYAWIEYVSEDISEYNVDNAVFTCSIEEVKEAIEAMKED